MEKGRNTLAPENDHVPSIFKQGWPLHRVQSSIRSYNSGILVERAAQGDECRLCSRVFNEEKNRSELVWQWKRSRGRTGFKLGNALDFPFDRGFEHYEDARIFEHWSRVFIAYTSGDYRKRPFLSTQMIAMLDGDWQPCLPQQINYGHNGRRSEKNWQFFSRTSGLHFVYSLNPHVVVRLGADMRVAEEFKTAPALHWPWGIMRGGTPPIPLEDGRYLSFFHSFVLHPTRNRRYAMSAYTFEGKPPFRILELTPPLLTGSGNDAATHHPGHPDWRPLVVFPCGAVQTKDSFLVSVGVNDSFDVLVQFDWKILGALLRPISEFERPKARYFSTSNGSLPLKVPGPNGWRLFSWAKARRGLPGAIATRGLMASTDPDAIETLKGKPDIEEISHERYEKER